QYTARADAGAEIQTGPALFSFGQVQRCNIGERRGIIAQSVPPEQLVNLRLCFVVKLFDRSAVAGVDAVAPFLRQGIHRTAAQAAEFLRIVAFSIKSELTNDTLFQLSLAFQKQSIRPQFFIYAEQAFFLRSEGFGGKLILLDVAP